MIDLICPVDRMEIQNDTKGSGMHCPACGKKYETRDKVIRFMESPSSFYEGAFMNSVKFVPKSESLRHVWPLWFINNGYVWFVRKHVPQGSRVLEIGCAAGVRYFSERYRMIGADLSLSSLKAASSIYELCLQADVERGIPLKDGSVDAVIGSFFWEHIPPMKKSFVLAECRRILKKGGRLVWLYDVETQNPLIRAAKAKDPELYRRLFIAKDGHLGYQTPVENRRLFEDAGFDIVRNAGMEKSFFQSPCVYEKFREWKGGIKGVGDLGSLLGKQPLFYAYTAFLRMIDTCVSPLLPMSWARIVVTVCRKRDDA